MWNKTCADILLECVRQFNDNHIKYFIFRNHEGLPVENEAKDVDIVVEPTRIKKAKELVYQIFRESGLEYYDEFVTGKMICMHGISLNKKMGIHIDLLEGFNIKGYDVLDFNDMYTHTEDYRGLRVMQDVYGSFLLFISKQYGQREPKWKQKYRTKIQDIIKCSQEEFLEYLSVIVSKKYLSQFRTYIENGELDKIFLEHKNINKQIKKAIWKRKPIHTAVGKSIFLAGKIKTIVLQYKKNSRTMAVIAPDGTGKSSFTANMIEQINFYYVADNKVNLYHFRPEIFPNLHVVGQKTGIVGEKEKTSDPHKFQPAGEFSSIIRMSYYTLDYILGWQKCIRNDVHYDRYSVFDRYSYDLLADPLRSRIKLPYSIRKALVRLTPKPKVVFLLRADAQIIYERKQELPVEEIKRQLKEYEKLADNYKNIYILNAEQSLEDMCEDAIKVLFEKYAKVKN